MRVAMLQEFMIAMECFFFEWYPDKDDEGSFGRVHVSNNTEAIEKSMKEGGVRSAVLPIIAYFLSIIAAFRHFQHCSYMKSS